MFTGLLLAWQGLVMAMESRFLPTPLDRAVVRDLQGLMAELIRTGQPTVVLVGHDPEDAARLAHRAVLIAGRPVRVLADIDLGPDPGARSREQMVGLMRRIEAETQRITP